MGLLRADSRKHAELSRRPCGFAGALYVHAYAGRAADAAGPHPNHHRRPWQLAMQAPAVIPRNPRMASFLRRRGADDEESAFRLDSTMAYRKKAAFPGAPSFAPPRTTILAIATSAKGGNLSFVAQAFRPDDRDRIQQGF